MATTTIGARRTLPATCCAIACAALFALTATSAPAATAETPYDVVRIEAPDPQADGRWAERVEAAGDVDDDGVPDFFVAVQRFDFGADNNRGRVYLLSGRTNKVLYRINSPQPQNNAQFGFFISAFGDVDGDGELDIAIGTDAQDVGANVDQGKAWVFSGIDGSLLYELDNPVAQPHSRFGSRLGSAGDVTGDAIADLVVGASNNDIPAGCAFDGVVEDGCYANIGQAFIFNGATGALVRTLDMPPPDRLGASCASNCGNTGLTVQSPGDTNGDGLADQLVAASNYNNLGRMYVFSGATGNVLLTIDPPEPEPGAFFGFNGATPGAPGDVNGDGLADVYANGFLQDGPAGEGQGRVWIFHGGTGALIRPLDDPTPTAGGQFGYTMATTDYNGDGTPDQYVGQTPHHVDGSTQNGGTYVFDGRTGGLLKALELPAADSQPSLLTNGGPRLGWTVAAPGDLNGDGEPDFLAGAPFVDVGLNRDQGRLYAFMSRPPAPAAPAAPAAPPAAPAAATAKGSAKLRVLRARIVRAARVLDVLASITKRASGGVDVRLRAAGRTTRLRAAIGSDGRIRLRRRIPAQQARAGTGIVTLSYAGDADTRAQTVRLRAAARRADLRLGRPRVEGGRLRATGTISGRARGVVRIELEYEYGGTTRVLRFQARIARGRWSLDAELSPAVQAELAARAGTLQSHVLFTGDAARGLRGEARSLQLLPAP